MLCALPRIHPKNEMHKVLWDFEIQTDHLISTRQLDLVIFKKKKENLRIVDFAFLSDHRVELKERETRLVLRFCQRTGKLMEHESDSDTNCNWRA